MGLKVLHPQEVEVFYVLPAVRKEFAAALKARGVAQSRIAGILGVTEAAVSQYFSKKRANIALSDETRQHITEAAQRVQSQPNFVFECQRILTELAASKEICGIHKQVGDVPQNCTMCFDGKVGI